MAEIQEITSSNQIEDMLSATKAVIFKNSTACPISSTARREFRKFAENCPDDIKLFMVDVIAKRNLSGEIAEKTGIRHESPQAIVLENGLVKWHGSHWSITGKNIQDAIDVS